MAADKAFRVRTQASTTSRAAPEDVWAVVARLPLHLVWSGERANDETFKLLNLQAPPGVADVGTEFTSTGANFNGTFHDRSVVTEASGPGSFVIATDARLDRKRGRTWEAHFEHRYVISAVPDGSMTRRVQALDRVWRPLR